jgi:hypothetical protein
MRLPTPHGWGQGIGSVVAGESGGTSRWSHGLCYLFSALRRDGLIPDKLSLNLPALLRSLNLFLKLRVWTVPHCLTTYQPRHGGKQDKHGPELSRFHSSTSVHGQAPHEVLRLTLARLTNCAPPATTKTTTGEPDATVSSSRIKRSITFASHAAGIGAHVRLHAEVVSSILFACCAWATGGHAVAAPASVMNSCRPFGALGISLRSAKTTATKGERALV